MKAKSSMMLAMAAGGVFAAGAMAAEPTVIGEFSQARIAGHVYVNVATGEVVRTPASSRLGPDIIWQNDDQGGCNFFYGQDRPTRDETLGRVKFGSAVVDWGDIAGGAFMNGYDAAYATNIGSDTLGTGILGLSMVNVFIDDYDGDLDPGGSVASGILAVEVGDINGGDVTLGTSLFQGWIYTIDLEGTGFEFNYGTTDLDGDGLHDMAHSYEWVQGQVEAKGIIGPFLVLPVTLGGTGTAFGVVDAFDWFNQTSGGSASLTDYVGGFWFGGAACPTTPAGSFWMTLYGTGGSSGDPCDAIDYNEDGLIDFGDYLEFLNRYDAQDASADLNMDGIVDFGDYLEFLNLFDSCQG